ncbi:MAG: hypothetical protein QY310_10660 [Candidatus Jettenia sp. CY-1]|nr:MAG: hypothetical protein QY310_10660 [Candidatus Jettenia sp. CY-1]
MTRLSQIFWGLVIVAVPGSILNLLFRHWLKLLYTFEVLLIIFGTVLNNQEIQRLGFISFGITLAIHLIVVLLGSYMRMSRRKRLFRTMITVIIAAIIFFAGVGMDEIFGWGIRHGFYNSYTVLRNNIFP